MRTENEQRYYDALKRITLYQSVEWLRHSPEKEWGIEYPESLEMAYENMKSDAARAIRFKRRPKLKSPQAATDGAGSTPEASNDAAKGGKL